MIQSLLRRALKPVIDESLAGIIAARGMKRERTYESLERLRGMTVVAGLRHLFNEKHLSICQLDACIAAARIVPDGETMRILKPLHCIDWADMKPELREEVFSRIVLMFGVDLEAIA